MPSKVPEKVLNNYFLNRINSGADTEMINLIKQNSFLNNWLPIGKIFLHHGDANNIVPYFNSADAYRGLTVAGGDINFYSYPGGTHDSEAGNFASKTINDFKLLKWEILLFAF